MNTPVNSDVTLLQSRRGKFAHTLDTLGVLDRMLWLRTKLGLNVLTVLTYHRVGRPEDSGELDGDVFDVEPEELARQIGVIREHGTLISLSDLHAFSRGHKLPPNPVLLTFDDGYLDNYEVALPVLQREGAQATFFIPTAFPDGGKLFWWDRIMLLMRRCQAERVDLSYPAPLTVFPKRAPVAAAGLLCQAIKVTPNTDMPRFWEELEQASGLSLSAEEERAIAARTIMGWAQVRALRDAGMDVQSHSHSHTVLNTLTPALVQEDLSRSFTLLNDALGGSVHSVAYPVGYSLEGPFRNATAGARFGLGFTNNTGLCTLGRFDPYNVPRVGMDIRTVGALYKLFLVTGDRVPHWPRRPGMLKAA